jgi:hypothetical protein
MSGNGAPHGLEQRLRVLDLVAVRVQGCVTHVAMFEVVPERRHFVLPTVALAA